MRNLWTNLCYIVVIFIIVLSITTWDTIYYSFQEQVDVYNSEEGYDYKEKGTGGNVKADVDFTLGEAGSIVTTTKRRGSSSKSTKYYYIIPVVFNSEPCFVCTEVSESKKSNFDSLANDGKQTIPLTGTFKKLDDKMYKYMLESIEDLNKYYENQLFENDTELKAHVLPVCLVPLDFENRNTYITILAVLVVFAIFFLFMGIRKAKKTAAREAAYEAELEAHARENMNQADVSTTEASGSTTAEIATENRQYQNTLDQFNDQHNQ
ncbi:MAG: hypothetical protein K2N51_00630 [Lachnospiraceae bacterium]|nr:hypothetical protein [Lachnospiraceae bacterium]